MRFEPLSLLHHEILSHRFAELQANFSEYSFANLYLFRNEHAYEVVFGEDIYIKGKTRDHFSYLMPTSLTKNWCCEEIKSLLQEVDFLFPIEEEWLPELKAKTFEIATVSGDSDYLFKVEKLSKLSGPHLSSRRNLLKQFNEHYPEHLLKPLDASNQGDAFSLLEQWKRLIQDEGDYINCREAIEFFQELKLTGYVAYSDPQTPVGFIIGEPLNKKAFVAHFAKGLTDYKGIYPFLYSSLAETLEGRFEWLNLEQDLGIPSLAQAKHAYEPDMILPKLRVQCNRQ